MMPISMSKEKAIITPKEASKILGSVPNMHGFYFYAATGNYIEQTASSLREFWKVLETIADSSIMFHIQLKDFQKWISDTTGDTELAERIDKINPTPPVEEIRKSLVKTVESRIAELEKLSKK